MGEALDLKQRYQLGERPAEGGVELRVLEDRQGDRGRQELGVEGGGADPHKGLELEEPAEHTHEQIDNDATFTNRDHGGAEDGSPSR